MSSDRWDTLEEKTLLDTPYLHVVQERVGTPARPQGVPWLNVRRKQAVAIAPRTPEGNYVLIHQERIPARATFWEFPAGQIDGELTAESIPMAALRELAEEAGYHPRNGNLKALGGYFSSPGFTNEYIHLLLAEDVVPIDGGNTPDDGESILETREFTVQELRTLIGEGEIQDANTLCLAARLFSTGVFA